VISPRVLSERLHRGPAGVAAAAFAIALSACERSPVDPTYKVLVKVESAPGAPIAGAVISSAGRRVGKTNEAGAVTIRVRGAEGDRLPVTVACPDGYIAPDRPTEVVLHRLDDPSRKPEYDVRCRPVSRPFFVIVRSDHGPRLPVLYLGKEIARTDESGAAHAVVDVPLGEDVEITLATVDPGSERLRPQNPSMKFSGAETNDLHVFSVQFQVEEPRAASARPALPVRIN
jgi:hypothetical protein